MTDRLKEQISAMVDDELPVAEQELLVARMAGAPELRDCWGRYSLISDALRQHLPDRPSQGLAERVMAAVKDEPALAPVRRAPVWLKSVASLAVAASVAVVAVIAVQTVNQSTPTMPDSAMTQSPTYTTRAQPVDTEWKLPARGTATPLDDYLVNHNEYAASNGVQGMLPYVRIVGYHNSP
ncbi:MAG TPA: sigma-E factor negative regulatory protein [Gammaproteobacteria bacterium]|nr:sigma-E factor negative regulatory protein [Gammaproteobacteria bacterium]